MTNVPTRRTCGAMGVHRRLLNTHPEYAHARAAIENRALAFARSGSPTARAGITTVPVVVHVVYSSASPEQNLTIEQIRSQIEVLNRDFRRLNPDTATVPSVFQGSVADARVEYRTSAKFDSAEVMGWLGRFFLSFIPL